VVQPPPRDDLFRPLLANHSEDQFFTNPDTPGLSVRVPAGVTIQGWDGVVKSRMAIERVAPDKLPTEAAPNGARSYYRISFGTPMGGVPLNSGSGPAAVFVTAPNDTGLNQGPRPTTGTTTARRWPVKAAGARPVRAPSRPTARRSPPTPTRESTASAASAASRASRATGRTPARRAPIATSTVRPEKPASR
jgi:hypothetical protein